MADIGGTVGLWLGLSALCLAELIEFLADITVLFCIKLFFTKNRVHQDSVKPLTIDRRESYDSIGVTRVHSSNDITFGTDQLARRPLRSQRSRRCDSRETSLSEHSDKDVKQKNNEPPPEKDKSTQGDLKNDPPKLKRTISRRYSLLKLV